MAQPARVNATELSTITDRNGFTTLYIDKCKTPVADLSTTFSINTITDLVRRHKCAKCAEELAMRRQALKNQRELVKTAKDSERS